MTDLELERAVDAAYDPAMAAFEANDGFNKTNLRAALETAAPIASSQRSAPPAAWRLRLARLNAPWSTPRWRHRGITNTRRSHKPAIGSARSGRSQPLPGRNPEMTYTELDEPYRGPKRESIEERRVRLTRTGSAS